MARIKSKWIIAVFLYLSVSELVNAQVQISINADQKSKPISKRLFGIFTEHIGTNVYQGAWSQIVENPEFVSASVWPVRNGRNLLNGKFKEIEKNFGLTDLQNDISSGIAALWNSSEGISGRLLKEGIRDFQQISTVNSEGFIQTGIFLPIHRVEDYKYSLCARADEPTKIKIQICHTNGSLIKQAQVSLNNEWTTIEGTLNILAPKHNPGDPYLLRLVFNRGVTVELDRFLLFPADNIDGWEPEVIHFVNDMKLPLLRFPGGNFVSGYDWKDGIGPIEKRPVLSNPAWPVVEWNHVGTDEWIKFCKRTGAEPMICVNAGDGSPEDAANWVRYCNGDYDTEFGKLRAVNASTEPYHVNLWEVGNELCGPWQIGFTDGDGYAKRYKQFADELLKADTTITLIANGQIRVLEKSEQLDRGGNYDWNQKLMQKNGKSVRSISVHSLVGGNINDDANPVEVWKDLIAFAENYPAFLKSLVVEPMEEAGVEPKIAITELMDWPTPSTVGNVTSISGALWYSAIINQCIRSNGLIELVTRSALMNHGGGLRKDRSIVYTQPVYWAHYMYSSQNGIIPLKMEIDSPTFNSSGNYVIRRSQNPIIDALALMDESGNSISVFVSNRDANNEHEIEISINEFNVNEQVESMMIHCPDLALRNSWDEPELIMPSFEKISIRNNKLKCLLPPLAMVRFSILKK